MIEINLPLANHSASEMFFWCWFVVFWCHLRYAGPLEAVGDVKVYIIFRKSVPLEAEGQGKVDLIFRKSDPRRHVGRANGL